MDSTGPLPPHWAAPAEPTCHRHPDRVSYLRCQRCERPVCPECQRPAAVGVHCLDCLQASGRAVPVTRTVFGAKAREGRPWVTFSLMAVCLVVFALEYVAPLKLLDRWDLVPAFTAHQPWRLLTSAVMHSTDMPLHIVMNLYCLYLLGPPLEFALGRWRFALSCLLCALGGSAGFIAIAGGIVIDDGVPYLTSAIGASGMVFGLFGIMLAVQRRLRRDLRGLLVVIAINLALPLLIPDVAWQGHIGGLVTGLACGAALAYAPATRRVAVQTGGLAIVLALVTLVTVVGLWRIPAMVP